MNKLLFLVVFICYSFYGFNQSNLIVEKSVGIGTETIGKALEVYGNILSKSSPIGGTAGSFAADPGGFVSFWVNDNYNPATHTSGWKRTLNLREGKVGIGTTDPKYSLDVEGSVYFNKYLASDANIILGGSIGVISSEPGHLRSNLKFCAIEDIILSIDVGGNEFPANFIVTKGDGPGADEILRLESDGDLYIQGNLTESALSDRRLKKAIEPLQSQFEKLMDLRPVSYQWLENNEIKVGLIAQEVEKVIPEMVVTDDKGYKRIRYDVSLQIRMIKAMQEQQEIINNQQSELKSIKEKLAEIEELKNRIDLLEK